MGILRYRTTIEHELAHQLVGFLVDAKSITSRREWQTGSIVPCGWTDNGEGGFSLVIFHRFADGSEIPRICGPGGIDPSLEKEYERVTDRDKLFGSRFSPESKLNETRESFARFLVSQNNVI